MQQLLSVAIDAEARVVYSHAACFDFPNEVSFSRGDRIGVCLMFVECPKDEPPSSSHTIGSLEEHRDRQNLENQHESLQKPSPTVLPPPTLGQQSEKQTHTHTHTYTENVSHDATQRRQQRKSSMCVAPPHVKTPRVSRQTPMQPGEASQQKRISLSNNTHSLTGGGLVEGVDGGSVPTHTSRRNTRDKNRISIDLSIPSWDAERERADIMTSSPICARARRIVRGEISGCYLSDPNDYSHSPSVGATSSTSSEFTERIKKTRQEFDNWKYPTLVTRSPEELGMRRVSVDRRSSNHSLYTCQTELSDIENKSKISKRRKKSKRKLRGSQFTFSDAQSLKMDDTATAPLANTQGPAVNNIITSGGGGGRVSSHHGDTYPENIVVGSAKQRESEILSSPSEFSDVTQDNAERKGTINSKGTDNKNAAIFFFFFF
eukprot:GHVR01140985.1.p1 GENE.GHVR01140985.1~~GHVR01140985.1.p1  ORF type:complete len:432 (+),score=60.42 GHVR01140985.1:174-1469(+)